jgi:hypothetical protein
LARGDPWSNVFIAAAGAELLERVGVSSKEEYERLQRVSEGWRVHSEHARLALEKHIAARGCWRARIRTECCLGACANQLDSAGAETSDFAN